jgi:hypothetical protein
VLRKTIRKKLTAKLKEVRAELKRRMHEPVPAQGAYLRTVVSGHIRYFGVPMNGPCIGAFHKEVCRMWMKVLRRRSQKHLDRWSWKAGTVEGMALLSETAAHDMNHQPRRCLGGKTVNRHLILPPFGH